MESDRAPAASPVAADSSLAADPGIAGSGVDNAAVAAELTAVIVAVTDGQPRVLTIDGGEALPSGPFEPGHRSLQAGLRSWVETQTHHPLGYVEQLYTFADQDRKRGTIGRMVSVSYLGLTREAPVVAGWDAAWQPWYRFFPWEDVRAGVGLGDASLTSALADWAESSRDPLARRDRRRRITINFGLGEQRWNEELVLQRYEMLWEAGLVVEGRQAAPLSATLSGASGEPMRHDYRRILATGIARLRAKIKYRPVVFELMPPGFTLLQLQRSVEALAGRLLHKQNFRRLIDQQDLVEETGDVTTETGGRPAKLFRFRGEVVAERRVAGTKLPLVREV
ncbi:NUDIX hydrolase [Rhodopila sp.]|uniref:NUDIX hydrolase n=1 Tax=Rhodopila sp. TaxID=2480087 RepID=UPI003D110764